MEKYYYGYNEFVEDTKILLEKVKPYNADVLLGISRGGLTLSHFLGQALNNRNVFTLNSIHYNKTEKLDTFDIFNIPDLSNAKKVLIIDDIIDTGETMVEILKILNAKFPHVEFKLATLFYKTTALVEADYTVKEAPAWIDFFWEVDL